MIFWKLFFIFLRIGIFSFGGGLAMIALIQNEVVEKQGWLTAQEFADVVATSQITPGPVGINTATYTGYTAVVNAGYPEWLGVLGALLASVSVILLPLLLMMLVWHLLMKHKANPIIASIMSVIRLAVVGMIAAAALLMITPDTFGSYKTSPMQHFVSIAIFVSVFVASFKLKVSPILLILLSGAVGGVLYTLL